MESRFFILLALIFVFQIGCDSQAAKNRNAEIAANYNKTVNESLESTNVENSNVSAVEEKDEEEELKKYSTAAEALANGNVFYDKNKLTQAVDAYRQAIEYDPELAEAHFKLGIVYSLIESEKEETQALVKETEEESNKKKPQKKASEKYFENAIKAYKKFVAKNKKDDTAYFNLGRAYSKLNEDVDAEKAFGQAAKLKPENSEYKTEHGASLIKLAKYDRAVSVLERALKLDETNTRTEDLLVEAKAGKKRVNFGKDKNKK